MTLHDAVERVLLEAGQPMSTREIAEQINIRALYAKRDGSPVSADQVRGRTRKHPTLFTQVGSIISRARSGDASRRPTTATSADGELPTPLPNKVLTLSPAESSGLEILLLDPTAFRLAGTIDSEVRDHPGLYAIRVRKTNALPEPFRTISEERGHDLLYLGIAGTSLSQRFLHEELRARGHGTFFRSLGAVLGYRPFPGSLIGKSNPWNYTFSPVDKLAIVDWINQNLLVNWVEFSGAQLVAESMLIRKHLPLFNIKNNPVALPELKALRGECVRIATSLPA